MKFTLYLLNGQELILDSFESLEAYLIDNKEKVDVIVPR